MPVRSESSFHSGPVRRVLRVLVVVLALLAWILFSLVVVLDHAIDAVTAPSWAILTAAWLPLLTAGGLLLNAVTRLWSGPSDPVPVRRAVLACVCAWLVAAVVTVTG